VQYNDFEPAVNGLEIYSDRDFGTNYPAGSELSELFRVIPIRIESSDFPGEYSDSTEDGRFFSAHAYDLGAPLGDSEFVPNQDLAGTHIFTVFVMLSDGRTFESRSQASLLLGP